MSRRFDFFHIMTKIKSDAKGGFMSEGIGGFLLLPKNISNLYPEQKI
jgi:hypothetical protein